MGMSFGKPTALGKSGIHEIVNQFVYTAEAAYRTGLAHRSMLNVNTSNLSYF